MMYSVKATKDGFVAWQGRQQAQSEEQAIEFARTYHAEIKDAKWTAEPA